MPTEEQWEYACRAGTTGPWTCEFAELKTYANLADQTAAKRTSWKGEDWFDGYHIHAPVGQFAANRFGLHDVHGNVFEWVQTRFRSYEHAAGAADDARDDNRVARGGCYYSPAQLARSAYRHRLARVRNDGVGVRPARALIP